MTTLGLLVICFLIFLWLGNKSPMQPLEGCESNAELSVYCDFMNPEDLALTPDGQFLIVAEFGNLEMIGCADMEDINHGGILFATMGYGFTNEDGLAITDNDFDADTDYWILLAEQDTGNCPGNMGTYTVLAQTGAMKPAEFLNETIEFNSSFGDFTILLQ